ncbi:glycine oxidase ThiO [Alcanivorax sp. S71-1-4]|uniref:NAD(P)/FAD-dependent oxidoreductase n=1 Tax=Alcanivorax sp. S71-1-4 TaxID=1177159 RepID=UPI0013588528|nr:FAD-dependent oxidoreductase [Alcanivorax sp. S71-1-4]KAF0806629.1 glycine oxidase ThiO [Alcanivorax sp. S71-1-4]
MADVLIIGGGMPGLLAAKVLRDRGVDVTLLDAAAALPPASWAGGGILSPLFPWRYPDSVTALALPALATYRALAEEVVAAGGIDPQVSCPGMRVLDEPDPDAALAWCARHGVTVEQQDGSLWLPDVGSVRNPRMLKGLRRLNAVLGVRQTAAYVSAIEPIAGGYAVHTQEKVFRAPQVVVSAGFWTRALLAPLGVDVDVSPVKGQMLLFRSPEPVPNEIRLAPDGYLIPRDHHTLVAGSTSEPGVSDQRPQQAAYQHLAQVAARLWAPLATVPPAAQWAGIRPGTARSAPLISEAPGLPGLFVCTGHYRNGLVCAPVSAALLADLVTGTTPCVPAGPYSFSLSSSSPP